jgi:ZF-HD class homeobox domain-containing protein
MFGFAMKIGWKIHKQDHNAVDDFCNEIEVKFHDFKVWDT